MNNDESGADTPNGFVHDYSEYDGPSDGWGTPTEVWRPFSRAVGGFDIDPCSAAEPTPIAEKRYTKEDDGLSSPWVGEAWVKPPYSDPGPWLEKAVEEVQLGGANRALVLLPARVHTNWFQNQLDAIEAVLFFNGKISFYKSGEGKKAPAPFACMLVIVGELDDCLANACERKGWLVSAEDFVSTTQQQELMAK